MKTSPIEIKGKISNCWVEFKEHFDQWCQVTTCAGVIDWHLSKTFSGKIFWAVLIAAALVVTIWQTWLVLKDFIQGSHYETKLSVLSNEPLLFPNISICNFNRVNQQKIGTFDKDVLSYGFQATAINYPFNIALLTHFHDLEHRWNKLKETLNITDVKDLFHKYGFTCKETFVQCTYGMFRPFNCCDYAWETIKSAGRCWTIFPKNFLNQDEPFKQQQGGVGNGIEMILNPMINSYVKNMVINNFLETGFMVSTSFDQQYFQYDYQVLQPGFHYWMKLKPTLYTVKDEVLPIWPKDCRENEDLVIYDTTYSRINCEGDCWAQLFVEKCNCSYIGPLKPMYNICSTRQILECVLMVCTKQPELCDQHMTECRKDCKNPCKDYYTVEATQTFAKFINDHNFDEMLNIWSNEQLSVETEVEKNETVKNLIRLEIFYPTLDYVQVETGESSPLFTFIGNVGGQLSLLLGISLITIIQALFYIFSCFSVHK